jgi:hypothetical protein
MMTYQVNLLHWHNFYRKKIKKYILRDETENSQ